MTVVFKRPFPLPVARCHRFDMTTSSGNRPTTGMLLLRDRIGDFTVRVTWPCGVARPPGRPSAGAVVFGEPAGTAAVAEVAATRGVLVLALEGVERVEAVVECLGWLADHADDFGVDKCRLALVALESSIDTALVAADLATREGWPPGPA
jgi:hypothetical protein